MYHYPLLSRPDFGFIRGPGPGFGNLLFPIGRALRESQIKNEVFVKPTILNLKIGPFLRQERDWRLYHNELKGRNVEDWLNFFRIKFYRKKTQFYYGQRNYFYDLEKSMFLIKNWLFTNSLEKPIDHSGKIAVHIRRGDFLKSNESALSHQIPTKWYLDTLDRLLCKVDMDVVLFSDSDIDNDWSKFGSRIKLSQNISACSNVLSMSSADFLIASRSTFSLWSYFLSNQKTFIPCGFDPSIYLSDSRNIKNV